ncbi:MAG TPA: hypothetical protein VGP99_11410 [Tepidisphaeraceae bacterium]|nr:hypothetical protein [Tepidisphaeraceae bacterium]
MRNSSDPFIHRQREQRLIEHVERLLNDDRLRIDTTSGRRAVATLRRDVRKEDREVDLKRMMGDMGIPDRQLQAKMPLGQQVTVTLSRTAFLIFSKTVGELRVVCLSPRRELLEGKSPQPLSQQDVKQAMVELVGDTSRFPTTIVLMSTCGFDQGAHELVDRRADRTLILVEPNDAGGWTVTGPAQIKALADLFDPEVDTDKRKRIREAIDQSRADLLSGGISAARLATSTKLPLQLIEEELKSYAKDASAGDCLVARRLEGNIVLFREGTAPPSAVRPGASMPFIDRVRSLFARKGDNEKKISLLSERRAALGIQRDRAFEEMGVLETRENEMRQQFKDTSNTTTKRRITSQLVQLRKDLERRQQLLGMLNQQINVVSTHLHNLELVQQGQVAALPSSEDLAADAAAAEEVLAELQANNEVAGSIGSIAGTGLSEEEQALYEELEREAAGSKTAEAPVATPATPTRAPAMPQRQTEAAKPPPIPTNRDRGEAEAS